MSRQVYRNDYRDEDDLQNKMFDKEVSSHWKARYPRNLNKNDVNLKLNILVCINFLMIICMLFQMYSFPSAVLDSQVKLFNMLIEWNNKNNLR